MSVTMRNSTKFTIEGVVLPERVGEMNAKWTIPYGEEMTFREPATVEVTRIVFEEEGLLKFPYALSEREKDIVKRTWEYAYTRPSNGPMLLDFSPSAIPMRLTCPSCNALHIDEGEFATKPHHTHSCQACGMTWRPAVVDTVGVRFLPGFLNPTNILTTPEALSERDLEAIRASRAWYNEWRGKKT